MCLTAILFKDNNNKIQDQCKLAVTNITGPQANDLDQGNWAISVTELQLPITLINLQPICSASPL